MWKERIILAAALLLLVPFMGIGAQSSYLDNGTNGAGVGANAYWDRGNFDGIGIRAGYSLAGILDLGLGLDMGFSEIRSYGARDVNGYIIYNIIVLKQQELLPLSWQIIGSYGLSITDSDYLADNALIRTGTGFSIGTVLFTDIMFAEAFGLRPGLFVSYRRYQLAVTTETSPVTDSAYPLLEVDQELFFGMQLGLLFKFDTGPVIAISFAGMIDLDLGFKFGPSIDLAFPTGS